MTADYTEANPGATITEQLTGLRHNSLYYLQVAANCGDGDYSEWSQMTVFRTTCPSDFQDVPYYEDFDSYLAFEDRVPQCWNYINTCGGTQNQYCPYISDNLEWSYCANQYLVMALTYYSYSNHAYYDVQDLYAILPRMKNIGDLKLSFSAKGEKDAPAVHANYYCTVTVGVFDDDNIFHEIADIAADRTAFTNHSVTFNGYSGDGKIAFLLRPPVSFGKEHSAVSIDNIAVEPVVHETVVPYTSNDDGWNLIASPVLGSIQPTDVENMIPGTEEDYDLFAFDQSFEGAEWRNYKVHGFALQNGQGYLYANSNPVTLSFAGAMQPAASVDVPLNYSTGNTFAGWNLIGNPFNVNATITGVSDYYRISGNMLAVSSGEIEPCEGIFVQATANGQSVTFARTDVAQGEPETKGALDFGLYAGSTNRCLDLARIRFGEGNNLGKLNLLSDPNKLYIPIDGKDYAVVHTTAIGELPLNFKAAENGRFTLAVNAEEVDLSYLHLVDNLTGMDIDLLSTPSYSFEAHFADYASRFKVVFAQGNSTDQESFGFIRDGHLLIFGEGQYTLQIIDMTGRVLSSDVISGNYDKQFNFAPGIYMLRLVNGNEVKVQKIMNK